MARHTYYGNSRSGVTVWKTDDCGTVIVANHTDRMFDVYRADAAAVIDGSITFDNPDEKRLGEIWPASREAYDEMREALDAGHCPICERWEDGNGNVCSADGWAE